MFTILSTEKEGLDGGKPHVSSISSLNIQDMEQKNPTEIYCSLEYLQVQFLFGREVKRFTISFEYA